KEVWGAGQQQVRNVYASIGALAVNLTLYSVVEVWAWSRPEGELVDRSRAPWDEEPRRPSHADKRKALQRQILRAEIRAVVGPRAVEARTVEGREVGGTSGNHPGSVSRTGAAAWSRWGKRFRAERAPAAGVRFRCVDPVGRIRLHAPCHSPPPTQAANASPEE